MVSTHSRPKAAGFCWVKYSFTASCFNTQPPEGGWMKAADTGVYASAVSTHSRPKAAGSPSCSATADVSSFNTQPPEGGWVHVLLGRTLFRVSTHSRPKAAGRDGPSRFDRRHRFNTQPPEGGWGIAHVNHISHTSFNTQPPEGGWRLPNATLSASLRFQHTAARRRLAQPIASVEMQKAVSTHSRPKAAGIAHVHT